MKKILVSDYDRTIYVDLDTTQKNIEAINRFKKNNIFVIATGRSFEDFSSAFEKFNIESNYYLFNYGSVIMNSNKELVYDVPLKEEEITEIISYFKNKKCEIVYCHEKENKKEINGKVYKIIIVYENKEEELKDYNEFKEKYNYNCFTLTNHFHIEVVSKRTTKAKAINFISQKEQIDNIYVIGDSENDIPMIKEYNGFAVEGATDEVKSIASKVYKSVESLIDELMEEKI